MYYFKVGLKVGPGILFEYIKYYQILEYGKICILKKKQLSMAELKFGILIPF